MNSDIYSELAFRFTHKLASHPLFNQYFQSVEDFIELTGFESHELGEIFSKSEEHLFKHFQSIGEELYAQYQPPFIDVASFLDYIARELITSIHKKELNVGSSEVTALNQLIQNAIAKSYFILTLRNIDHMVDNSNEPLNSPLKIHFNWLKKVVAYFNQDSKQIPETDHLTCKFAHWLNSMECELLLACTGQLRDEHHGKIFLAHRKVHQQFTYVMSFVRSEEYALAYSHLIILYQTVLELDQHIRGLQLKYKENESLNFYHYIELKSAQEEQLFYFLSIKISHWKILDTGSLVPRNSSQLKQDINNKISQKGLEGVVLLTENEIRLFIHKKDHDRNIQVETFLEQELHPFIESFAAENGIRIRTIGISLDNLNSFKSHKIAMLKQLPDFHYKNTFKVLSHDEADELFSNTVESEQVASYVNKALENHQLEVFFQPILNSDQTSRIYVEALVRAPSDEGYIPADKFIQYLERENKMLDLDLFVISRIREYIPVLKKSVNKLSINIYPTSFREDIVVQKLIELSEDFNRNNMQLVVEITEQLFLTDTSSVEMLALDYGIAFSMDDFGSGYSNLLQLVDLAERDVIQILKIDGSLVKKIDKDEKIFKIIETITQIASILGITPIVMEYVQNEIIHKKLETLDSNIYYQGFYFDKPLPLNELMDKYAQA